MSNRLTQSSAQSIDRVASAYREPEPLSFASERLAGRVVLVTGASSGIGAAAVRRFAAEGATVVAAARRTDRLEALVVELREAGHDGLAVSCDVTDETTVREAVTAAMRAYGRLDGAFNSAGIPGTHELLHKLEVESFDRVIATNLRGAFLCMKHEISAMLESGGGSIVNTSSVGGLVGRATNADYGASKFGLSGLVRYAAVAYARHNIRVNAIAPGPTRTEMFDRLVPTEEDRAQTAESFPMNFIADPDDMARAALFLLSDEARWTTGIVLACEGGVVAG